MLEWIQELEEQLPDSLGFGRLVGVDYHYWHPSRSSDPLNGKELVERVGETLKVARMYGVQTDRVKFTCSEFLMYIVAPSKGAVCVVLPHFEDRDETQVWKTLETAHRLAPVEKS